MNTQNIKADYSYPYSRYIPALQISYFITLEGKVQAKPILPHVMNYSLHFCVKKSPKHPFWAKMAPFSNLPGMKKVVYNNGNKTKILSVTAAKFACRRWKMRRFRIIELRKGLAEACDVNDELRSRVAELEATLSLLQERQDKKRRLLYAGRIALAALIRPAA